MNGLALCAGYGGLELGIERILPEARTVCYVEGEAFAAQHLIQKMENGSMDEAPIWSNVKSFDGFPWRGKVDWISGGFPCQPYSTAGKQMGEEDPRDLWPDFVRIIGEVRPGFIFLENVPNVVKLRLDQIVLDLDKLGYHASWCVVAASDVGAPHRRKRWFCLAVLRDANGHGFNESETKKNGIEINRRGDMAGHGSQNNCKIDSHTQRKRFNEDKQSPPTGKFDFEGLCGNLADAHDQRMGPCIARSNGKSVEQSQRGNANSSRSLSDAESKNLGKPSCLQKNVSYPYQFRTQVPIEREFTSIKMPGSQSEKRRVVHNGEFERCWEVEPSMGRLVDGSSDWVDKLRLLGNGVVPQQAAYAFQILGERLAAGIVEKRTPKD